MAWNNQQMSEMIENGIRGTVVKHTVTEDDFQGMSTYINLTRQLHPIQSWQEFKEKCQTRQLTGNTKYSDLWILMGYYFQGLSPVDACNEIGYITQIKDGKEIVSNALYFRLRRVNITNPFVIVETIINKGWMPRSVMQNVLITPKNMTVAEANQRRGKFYRFYSKFYVVGAVEAHHGDIEAAAETLQIPISAMDYWLNLEVNDPRVQSTEGE